MIEVRELSKRYGGTLAVDGLDLTVRPGRVTGFLGPNGAGKSTTLRLLLGLDRPDRGRALIDGRRYVELREPLRHVGALLESGGVQRGRTGRHHLAWLARSNRLGRRRVDEVLALVGLDAAADRRVRGYSLGMCQRLGIAAALLGDPATLLLDEPVNGLDPEGVRWIRTLLRELAAEGRTVLLSSHLMNEMALTADHLVVIARGRLLADASMADFIARHCAPTVRVRTPEPERLAGLLAAAGTPAERLPGGGLAVPGAPGEPEVPGEPEAPGEPGEPGQSVSAARVGRLAAAHGIALDELTTEQDSLEDAFLRLTADAAGARHGE